MKKIWTPLMGLALAAVLAVPALADNMNARVKSVDATANTITVVEKKQDFVFTVNADTKFLNVAGEALAGGIASGDLKPGARLAITFDKKDDKSIASEVKLRPAMAKHPIAPPVAPPADAPVTPK